MHLGSGRIYDKVVIVPGRECREVKKKEMILPAFTDYLRIRRATKPTATSATNTPTGDLVGTGAADDALAVVTGAGFALMVSVPDREPNRTHCASIRISPLLPLSWGRLYR